MSERIPEHIAIIMDGNGRWARSKGLPRIEGHRVGSRKVRKIALHAANRGVKYLTLYAFSKENWSRPSTEVQLLMALLKIYAIRERAILMKENIRLNVIGDLSSLPEGPRKELEATMRLSEQNTRMILQLALSYGSRAEITSAVQKISQQVGDGKLSTGDIDEALVSRHLMTAGQPDPDLIIRTSGEHRISNFLLWQAAYSELYFTPKSWPEFEAEDFDEAISDFQIRERRFGALSSDSTTTKRKAHS